MDGFSVITLPEGVRHRLLLMQPQRPNKSKETKAVIPQSEKIFMRIAVLLIPLIAITVFAQVQPPPAPWRGAGGTPCVGSDGGVIQCARPARTIAVRAGRLFDSKSGQMLTRQVIVVQGERI